MTVRQRFSCLVLLLILPFAVDTGPSFATAMKHGPSSRPLVHLKVGPSSPSCLQTAVTALAVDDCNQLTYETWKTAETQLLGVVAAERKVVGWSAAGSSQTAWAKYANEECKLESAPSAESRLYPGDYYACAAYQTNLRIKVIKTNLRNLAAPR